MENTSSIEAKLLCQSISNYNYMVPIGDRYVFLLLVKFDYQWKVTKAF